MNFTASEAYQLGSMPRRVFRTLSNSRSAEDEAFVESLGLAETWLGLLSRLKVTPVFERVRSLRDRLLEERDHQDAVEHFRKTKTLYEVVRRMDSSVVPPDESAPAPLAGEDSLELSRLMLDPQNQLIVREHLPDPLQELHELGDLVARCRWEWNVDAGIPMRVWTIVQRLRIESWVTGLPAGASIPIERAVVARSDRLDELLLTQPLELPAVENQLPAGPYLTIAEAASLLQVGEDTVERLINSGQLTASEISGKGREAGRKFKRIRREAIDTFLKQSEKSPQLAAQSLRRRKKADRQKDYFES